MKNTLLDIIREDVRLIAIGKNFVGLCPFHTEEKPSFAVNPQRGKFECFGCGKSGGIKEYLEFRAEKMPPGRPPPKHRVAPIERNLKF